PPLAVAHELKQRYPNVKIDYALEKGSRFKHLPEQSPDIDRVYTIFAGKLRRYHGESWLRQLLDISTILKNLRDVVLIVFGVIQCVFLLKRLRPNAVFIKGGFVGVPVGLACALWRIPYMTHDSDTVPGLANRMIARWARYHAVGMPPQFYTYPKNKMRYTGIPLSHNFYLVSEKKKTEFRRDLKLPIESLVICVTGGSLGAARLNLAVREVVPTLLDKYSDLYIVHQTGEKNQGLYEKLSDEHKKHIVEFGHTTDLYRYTGAADLVIARAGATTIAELALQAKACLFVPNPQLTGGQQTKNAEHLEAMNAAVIVSEHEMRTVKEFTSAISSLIDDQTKR